MLLAKNEDASEFASDKRIDAAGATPLMSLTNFSGYHGAECIAHRKNITLRTNGGTKGSFKIRRRTTPSRRVEVDIMGKQNKPALSLLTTSDKIANCS
jgi:hypothetical protein